MLWTEILESPFWFKRWLEGRAQVTFKLALFTFCWDSIVVPKLCLKFRLNSLTLSNTTIIASIRVIQRRTNIIILLIAFSFIGTICNHSRRQYERERAIFMRVIAINFAASQLSFHWQRDARIIQLELMRQNRAEIILRLKPNFFENEDEYFTSKGGFVCNAKQREKTLLKSSCRTENSYNLKSLFKMSFLCQFKWTTVFGRREYLI